MEVRLQNAKNDSKTWKDKFKEIGKWALALFIIFEITQIVIGIFIGIIVALQITGISL